MSILLITHDLGVVAENADAVAAMYASKSSNWPPSTNFSRSLPKHPYTEGLFRAVPRIGSAGRLKAIPRRRPIPAVSVRLQIPSALLQDAGRHPLRRRRAGLREVRRQGTGRLPPHRKLHRRPRHPPHARRQTPAARR